jgi:hypothetical protein
MRLDRCKFLLFCSLSVRSFSNFSLAGLAAMKPKSMELDRSDVDRQPADPLSWSASGCDDRVEFKQLSSLWRWLGSGLVASVTTVRSGNGGNSGPSSRLYRRAATSLRCRPTIEVNMHRFQHDYGFRTYVMFMLHPELPRSTITKVPFLRPQLLHVTLLYLNHDVPIDAATLHTAQTTLQTVLNALLPDDGSRWAPVALNRIHTCRQWVPS